MKYRPGILLLFLLFVALSANSAWACGHSGTTGGKVNSEKSCCAKKGDKKQTTCAKETGGCGQKHAGQKCPGSTGHGGCHCPCAVVAGGPTGAAIEAFPPLLSLISASSEATLRQAFYYAQHLPEAVYLPIWQPPQLAA